MDSKIVNTTAKSPRGSKTRANTKLKTQTELNKMALEMELEINKLEKEKELATLQLGKDDNGEKELKIKEIQKKLDKKNKEHNNILYKLIEVSPDYIEIEGQKYQMVWDSNVQVELEQYYSSIQEWREQFFVLGRADAALNAAYAMINEYIKIQNFRCDKEPKKDLLDKETIGYVALESLQMLVVKTIIDVRIKSNAST